MKETEITVEILDDVNNLIEMLKNKNFSLVDEVDMIDYYFSKIDTETLKNMQYLDIINNSFIVRQIIGDEPSLNLMFKSKELDELGNVIAEEKVKTPVENLEKAIKIFKLAGLNNWCEIKQHMLVYKREETEFAIQIVDGLGSFIEYEETPSMSELTEQEKIDAMLADLKSIGINFGDDYSCKKVYMKFKKENM
jgi:predicted adenylyl cyclase CyaB